ncbi:hypothetical protein K2173_025832 [Erythroxylum novogranatense]|uniref:Enhancer of polycomb-like protein n=1 Tax=Erythroxylum novogranatense TaxID=1862640 RepID=A0AAV8SHD0_9ROSI|nr:hypothetical protein K2173_025832 [Erythroxylum novogranatense]
MEHRVANSYGAEIPRKSRSLDLKSIYKSIGTKEIEDKMLKKRKDASNDGSDEKKIERKKSRKEVSISSLKSNGRNGSKSLEDVYNSGLSSGSRDSKDSKSGLSRRLNDSSGYSSISLTLDDGVIKVPRRKRGFVGRRKDQNGSVVLKQEDSSCGEIGNVHQVVKLASDDTGKSVQLLEIDLKKSSDGMNDNRSSGSNLSAHLEEEDVHISPLVVETGDSKRSRIENSVENNVDASLTKSLRKRSRKRKTSLADSENVRKESDRTINASIKGSGELLDEDEENLEENAARMLSSRFDPSFTGFSSSSKSSALPSTNELPVFVSSSPEIIARASNYVSESESSSADTAARVLRPRKKQKEKGSLRKRRHYYEILSEHLDAYWVLNRRIKVFWPLDKSWYYGLISDYDCVKNLHHVKYDDRDEEWIDLQNERFKLLLLPSEVPSNCKRRTSVSTEKHSGEEKGKGKPVKEKKRNLVTEDDGYAGNHLDSEPIITWLNRGVKSSHFHALKKQKPSGIPLISVSMLLSEEPVNRCERLDMEPMDNNLQKLYGNSALADSLPDVEKSEDFGMNSHTCPHDHKPPLVYYRKRYRKTRNLSSDFFHKLEEVHVVSGLSESDNSLISTLAASSHLEEHDISPGKLVSDENWKGPDTSSNRQPSEYEGQLKLNILLVEYKQVKSWLNFPVISVLNFYFGADYVWLFRALLLLQYGSLATTWPRVHLEMLFIDNYVGLRFLFFEGCLQKAIALVFQILTVFDQPNELGKYDELQLPVTSIRLKISCILDSRRQLVSTFYNFFELDNAKWLYLDNKLKSHCLFTRKLPLSECTYDNIKMLQNGMSRSFSCAVFRECTSFKVPGRRSRQSFSLMAASKESTHQKGAKSYLSFDKNYSCFPPFALSFTAAPTFFLGLHLKLLMEYSMTHISLLDNESIEHLETCNSWLEDDSSFVEGCFKSDSVNTLENDCGASFRDIDSVGCLSIANSETHALSISFCSTEDRMNSSAHLQNGDAVVHTCLNSRNPRKVESDITACLQNCQDHDSGLCDLSPGLSIEVKKSDLASHSLLRDVRDEIPSVNQFDKHVDIEPHRAQQSAELPYNMVGDIVPSSNPTARRSTSHRIRSSSMSYGYHWPGWSDGKPDAFQNNFGNGPKKPRTQVSYTMPFGGFDYSSRNKNHQQKGFHHKRIRTANEKCLNTSRSSERNMELLSCDANLLITHSDRGWRECGVQVVLELFDHNEWRLAVKLSGVIKYSYKAHQFLQTGSTNRFTHAMMWKGGKDWTLEFLDRSQWALFKEMHEECYNRNIRAASVKNIPIPGVRLIEEHDDNGIEIPFVRISSKYFRQIKTDVEMALDPSRVLYDMDSDDEQWLLENKSSLVFDNNTSWNISEEMLEKTMDMLEKAAYSQDRDQFTGNEMEELMAGVGHMEAIKTIHEYWQKKRLMKGMALIRHLQPPLWEKYQQQVREWELAVSKCTNSLPSGCHEKTATMEKPPMFAFCLKPRGLEVPNKGSKQRSQKKYSVAWQSTIFAGDHDGLHGYGRKSNGFASGDERFMYAGNNDESLDDSPLPQMSPTVFSPGNVGGTVYFPRNGDRYQTNHLQKFHRNKSKKHGMVVSPKDQMVAPYDQGMFNRRSGAHWWNMGFYDWPNQRPYVVEGSSKYGLEQLDGSDLDEFRMRDASAAARQAVNKAKVKRDKAQQLLYRADVAIQKAVIALMTAEAIKASSNDLNSDG